MLKKKKKSVTEKPKEDPQLSIETITLPCTGIEQPFLRRRPVFIKDAPNFEPINKRTLAQQLNQ